MTFRKKILLLFILTFSLMIGIVFEKSFSELVNPGHVLSETIEPRAYWLILHRKSQTEELLRGVPGDRNNSELIKTFSVKPGMPGERPTPLPQTLGKRYWIITEKHSEVIPETAPYFLTLNIPAPEEEPYGPTPYLECNGQCQWILPGAFGLHGTGGDPTKITDPSQWSSGCVRHSDEDITYLYHVLEPNKEEIRYYVEDN